MTGQPDLRKPLQTRLRNLSLLKPADEVRLEGLLSTIVVYEAGTTMQPEQSRYEATRILLEGWAFRFRTLDDGSRQIVNFLLPGDTVGLYGALFPTCVSGVELISDVRVAELPCESLFDVFAASSRLGAALCWIAGQDERFLEQQIVRIGRLNAQLRIAHLLLELFHRAVMSGASPLDAATIPIGQTLIAEALGLSHVHVNRSLRALREKELIEVRPQRIRLLQPDVLKNFSRYDFSAIDPKTIPDRFRQRLNSRRR
ncbi:MAG: Crp/Fnr family transcriptional regulator [Wenzhouxiangellaceae bacterium]|nr:Crp/Fnr family transcriptional regulator [Wenzhouxiangellaceae bacterium]